MAAPMDDDDGSSSSKGAHNLLANKNIVWKPRITIEDYADKLKDCQSLGNMFHHYYIYGVKPTCELENQDFINAVKWKTSQAEDAKNALQERELKRKENPHVWKMRDENIPPKEWTIPIITENTEKQ
ncbi:synaptic plasticity regulator PANTS-like [Antedon mediterranea]|uniref:synaptic plasticity regulator PANTS-like n=1 Tax=Antedon mediterranea TaxID=105859 RepID=UPI003AF82101